MNLSVVPVVPLGGSVGPTQNHPLADERPVVCCEDFHLIGCNCATACIDCID